MNNFGFNVIAIKNAQKSGCVVADVVFDSAPDKVYTYVRKNYGSYTVIDGCKVSFDSEKRVTGYERLYETEGKRKRISGGTIGKGSRSEVTEKKEVSEVKIEEAKKIFDKVKEEMSVKNIELPKVETNEESYDGVIFHKAYEEIRDCLECNIPVYLAGPAGAGKNYTVEQIAQDLGWNFYFSNSVQQEYKLTGFIDAGGNFHETEFYKACNDENDCIFFLDEMDASIPEVLVLLNAAIANGYFEFPNGRVNLDHVHFVAAGNTVGSGADDVYTGRMVIDQATLDRFAIIEFDYDERVELQITRGNKDLVNFIHSLRNQAKDKGIRATFSLRCLTMVCKLEAKGMQLEKIIKIAVVKGLDTDTINTFSSVGNSKYFNAFRNVQRAA